MLLLLRQIVLEYILTLFSNNQVRKFVIRREVQPKGEGKKPYTKAPRIQRLVTPQRLQHKRHRMALKRRQAEASKDAAVSPSFLFLSTFFYTYTTYTLLPSIYTGTVCTGCIYVLLTRTGRTNTLPS